MTHFEILAAHAETVSLFEIQEALNRSGLVILRHRDHERPHFLALSEALSDGFVTQQPKGEYRTVSAAHARQRLNAEGNLFSVGGQGQCHPLPLHGEFYFQSQEPPGLLWFFCEAPSRAEGHTLICDGQALFQSFPVTLQHCFSQRALRYRRYHTREQWQAQFHTESKAELCDYLSSQGKQVHWEGDTVCVDFLAPACRKRGVEFVFVNNFLPFALKQIEKPLISRARVDFHDDYEVTSALVKRVASLAAPLTRPLIWQQGDIVLVDNTRMMHGRQALDPGDTRKVSIRMARSQTWMEKLESYEQSMARITGKLCHD